MNQSKTQKPTIPNTWRSGYTDRWSCFMQFGIETHGSFARYLAETIDRIASGDSVYVDPMDKDAVY